MNKKGTVQAPDAEAPGSTSDDGVAPIPDISIAIPAPDVNSGTKFSTNDSEAFKRWSGDSKIVNPDGSAKYPEGKRPNGVVNFGQNL